MGDQSVFVGIDVAFAQKKRLPIVIARWQDGRLVPFPLRTLPFQPPRGLGNAATLDEAAVRRFANQAVDYVEAVCLHLKATPVRIALDAPSMPTPKGESRRKAERALDASGISCFTTPSAEAFEGIKAKVRAHLKAGEPVNRLPHANQLWMLVGFELYQAFSRVAPCLEVFPQETVKLLGAADIYKMKQGGADAQLAATSRFTGWPVADTAYDPLQDIAFGPRHDGLDAYLSAWVAALAENQRLAMGSPPDDVIWVPNLEMLSVYDGWKPTLAERPERPLFVQPKINNTAEKKSETESGRHCPGCGQHYFVRWPYGWDAHAAHKCMALKESDPVRRKAEFKSRFM
ncbi:MAG: DUF429 domain-containing protein [Saccharospirillum sp.]